MTDQKKTATETILADLPALQQIALRPAARHPLLAILREQAQALDEIAHWAGTARKLLDDEQTPPATLDQLATAMGAESVDVVEAPAENGAARPLARQKGG